MVVPARSAALTDSTSPCAVKAPALTWTVGQAIIARRPHTEPRRAVALGYCLLIIGIILVTPVLWSGWPLWATFLSWPVGGLGMGILFNPTTVASMSYADPGQEGQVSSQLHLADSLGFSMMGGIGGAIVAMADRTSIDLAFSTRSRLARMFRSSQPP